MKGKILFFCTFLVVLLRSVSSQAVDVLSWGKEAAFSGHIASVVALATDQVGVYPQGWKFEIFDKQKTQQYLLCLRTYHTCSPWGCSVDPSVRVLYGFEGCKPENEECSFTFKAFITGKVLGLDNHTAICTLQKPIFTAKWSNKKPEFYQGFISQDDLQIYQSLKNGRSISVIYFYPLGKGKASLVDVMYEKGPFLTKFVEGNYKFFRIMLKKYQEIKAKGYKYPRWWQSFDQYNCAYPSCQAKGTFWQGGGLVKVDCGSFKLEYSRTDLLKGRFNIEGNLVNQLNSQFISIVGKNGIKTSSEIKFTPLLINYIIEKTPPTFWVKMGWRYYITHQEEFGTDLPYKGLGIFLSSLKDSDKETDWIYLEKVLMTTSRLMDIVNNADFKTLNMIIEDFIKERVQ